MEGRKIKRNLNEELTQVVINGGKKKGKEVVILLNWKGLTQFVETYDRGK